MRPVALSNASSEVCAAPVRAVVSSIRRLVRTTPCTTSCAEADISSAAEATVATLVAASREFSRTSRLCRPASSAVTTIFPAAVATRVEAVPKASTARPASSSMWRDSRRIGRISQADSRSPAIRINPAKAAAVTLAVRSAARASAKASSAVISDTIPQVIPPIRAGRTAATIGSPPKFAPSRLSALPARAAAATGPATGVPTSMSAARRGTERRRPSAPTR